MRPTLFVLWLGAASSARMSMWKAAEEAQVEPLKVAIDGRWDEYEERRVKPDIDGRNKKGQVALHLFYELGAISSTGLALWLMPASCALGSPCAWRAYLLVRPSHPQG